MTVVGDKDLKEVSKVKGDQSWVFIARTPPLEAETPILCPPDAKS